MVVRRIGQDQVYFFSENRTSLELILVFEVAERVVPNDAIILHRRLQHFYLPFRLQLRSAGAHGNTVDSVLLFQLPLHLFVVFCSRLFTFSVSISLMLSVSTSSPHDASPSSPSYTPTSLVSATRFPSSSAPLLRVVASLPFLSFDFKESDSFLFFEPTFLTFGASSYLPSYTKDEHFAEQRSGLEDDSPCTTFPFSSSSTTSAGHQLVV